MDLPAGTQFAGYTIMGELGTGGMGAVYLVRHPRLPRQDAMKVIHKHLSADPVFAARFDREAELACTLDHPALVKVYDRGMDEGRLWITMQYIRGLDADHLLQRDGPLDAPRAVRIVSAIADALDHAHAAGMVHRDVKPANILLTQSSTGGERAFLTDFGIAHTAEASRQLTNTGELLASLPYAAPEQLEGRPITAAVDTYALGCVLYELVTGRRLFAQETPPALMAAVLNGPRPDVWDALPPDRPLLKDVIRRAVAQDPADRFPSCGALAAAAMEAVPPAPVTVVASRPADSGRSLVGTAPAGGPLPASSSPPPAPSMPWLAASSPPPAPSTPWPESGPSTWPPQPVPPPRAGGDGFGAEGVYGPPIAPPPPRNQEQRRRWWLVLVPAVVLVLAAGVLAVVLLTRGLPAPGSVVAEAQADGVEVRWAAVDGAEEYEVRRDGVAVGRTTQTSYVDAEVGSGVRVTYTVITVGQGAERSDPSESRTLVSALHPADVNASTEGDAVTLTWSPVENAERYEVRRGDRVVGADITEGEFAEDGLDPGTHAYTVLAFDDDGGAPSSSASAEAQVSPWLAAEEIAVAFADLLPDEPGAGGWGDSTCGIGELVSTSPARAVIYCEHPSGIYVEFTQYPDQAALDERIAFLDQQDDPESTNSTHRGGWYRQSPPGADPAWEAWGFTEPGRELMEIYIQWAGHTVADLDTTWYYEAPW